MQRTAQFQASISRVHEVNLHSHRFHDIGKREAIDCFRRVSRDLKADRSMLRNHRLALEMTAPRVACGTGRSEIGG